MNLKETMEERGVSPVIGVILMVAITVILAAVIAAFVLDLGQSQGANAQAGLSFSDTSDEVRVTVNSVSRADELRVSGSGDCSYLYEWNTGTSQYEKVDHGDLAVSAGASVSVYTGADDGIEDGADYICVDTDRGSDFVEADGYIDSVGSGTVQIIGVLDGSESVINDHDI